jgi:thioredoxin-related protein
MKKNIIIIIWIVSVIIVVTSCNNNKNPEKTELNFLTHAIEQIQADGQYQWVVILPGMGCHGCIQEGEFFMKDYITNRQILFVLTKTSSLKILQQKTEIRISEHPNIYVDKYNLFDIPTENKIYPCVVYLKEGKIIKHSFQSPGNPTIYQLEEELSSMN